MGVLSGWPRWRALGAALAWALAVPACSDSPAEPYANSYALQFSAVWERFKWNYPLFDVREVDWTRQWDAYEPRARQLRSQTELVALLQQVLAPLHDSQVWLVRPDGARVETYPLSNRLPNWDEATLREYAPRATSYRILGESFAWARFGDVGYLLLGSLERADVSASAVGAALDSLRGSRALILDVRMNHGGDMGIADSIASHFTTAELAYGFVQWRQGTPMDSLTAPQSWGIRPLTPQFPRPCFLLTGRQTTGAGEQLVLAMRLLPQVLVLGDTTGGSMGSAWEYDLGGGWKYAVPRFRWTTRDRKPIEGVGLAPALPVRVTAADFARHADPVLDTALARAVRTPTD